MRQTPAFCIHWGLEARRKLLNKTKLVGGYFGRQLLSAVRPFPRVENDQQGRLHFSILGGITLPLKFGIKHFEHWPFCKKIIS